MEKQLLREIEAASGVGGGGAYIDRGDPAGYDYTLANFTRDGAWHDLDLSAIVPAGAIAVKLIFRIVATNNNNVISLREKGNSNVYNKDSCYTIVANETWFFSPFVFCNSNRVIQYLTTATNWTSIDVVICGWFTSGATTGYVDRGDPGVVDKSIGDFTLDGNWYDLDLSAIVPAGAKVIHIRFVLTGNANGLAFKLEEKGNTNHINILDGCTQAADCAMHKDGFVTCDSNRVISYAGSPSVNWSNILLVVRGWII